MKTEISLYVIDAQNDFLDKDEGSLYVPGSDGIIQNIVAMIEWAGNNGYKIIPTRDVHQYTCPEFTKNGGPHPEHCIADSKGSLINLDISRALLNSKSGVTLPVNKDHVDVWEDKIFSDRFDAHLLEYSNQTVIVVGVASDYCVKAAVAGFLKRGVSVYVPANCVKGVREEFNPTWFDQESRSGLLFVEPQFNEDSFHAWCSYDNGWFTKDMCPKIAEEIEEFIRERVLVMGKAGAVIGISGGADSALVTIAAHFALKGTSAKLHGLHIPAGKVTRDYQIAKFLGEETCTFFSKLSLGTTLKIAEKAMNGTTPYYSSAEQEPLSHFDRGNMISRLRANFIHTYAARHNLLVLGTGNKDEDFGLGYYTLFGDGAVHCSPIGDLSKRMVKHMLTYYSGLLETNGCPNAAWTAATIVNKEPTAGLEPNQTDFGDLGYSYEFAEAVIAYSKETRTRFRAVYNHIYNIRFAEDSLRIRNAKFSQVKDALLDVLLRHRYAEMKAEIVHPPICSLSRLE